MTKEEKIKEAWGQLIPDYTNIDLNNGWSLDEFNEGYFDEDKFHTMQIIQPCKIRPKTLNGIESNNGWIKIKSEDDLPKEDGIYWVKDRFRENVYQQSFCKDLIKSWLEVCTHYQPIFKPEPPIY